MVHLFSGRRREGDFHAHLTQLCRNAPFAVTVLSLDTAVSQETGNLAERSDSWIQIDKLYRAGLVAFTLAGSPCETFSEARHQRPEDPQEEDRWPRPLRSARELWGLVGLTRRELNQVQVGSLLHLQTLYLLLLTWLMGGSFVSEHPAIPRDPERASTWTSALMTITRKLRGIKLDHIQQFRWGASTVKPTALLHAGLPNFWQSMNKWKLEGVERPTAVAIGKDSQGRYKTAQAKEYPRELGGAFAQLAYDRLMMVHGRRYMEKDGEVDREFSEWYRKAVQDSGNIRNGTYLPDYQPFN